MGIIITEIDDRTIYNFKMRTVRAVAGAVNNIHFAVVYLCSKCSRKAGTVVIGNKGGIRNIHVLSAIAAIPFQCVLLIVFDFKF